MSYQEAVERPNILPKRLSAFGCFWSFALVYAKLRCGKGRAASPASPACKRAGHQVWPVIAALRLARTHRQNQFSTAVRTFAFLHSPYQSLVKVSFKKRVARHSVPKSTSVLYYRTDVPEQLVNIDLLVCVVAYGGMYANVRCTEGVRPLRIDAIGFSR